MKKTYLLIVSLLIAQYSFAQNNWEPGWPSNYGGVMLQGFYWNSYKDTQWTKFTEDVDNLSTYFDIIWLPNSGFCTDGESMGYDPLYWFRHKSSFGQARELIDMIKAYKAKNVSIIEDVVLNHKKPEGKNGSWIDFIDEHPKFGGVTYDVTWTGADICKNDDGGYTAQQGWPVTGADDTGDDFSGFRDLDHTSTHVQENIKIYLRYLMEYLGYDGFRLDMVKGYHPRYTKIYNEAVKPKFCVGEYWDGYDAITNWMSGTGKTSAAFDFPLKYQINKACNSGDWDALNNKGIAGDPNWNQYAITFIDNHDTYEKGSDRLVNNVPTANAIILALPGTPCIFLKHWQSYPIAIGNMILARKAAGLTNQSSITKQYKSGNGYVIETQGTKGSVLCLCGTPSYDTNGWKCISAGQNYAFYVSNNVNVDGLRPGTDNPYTGEIPECVKPIEGHIYCYFQANKDFPSPNIWVFDADGKSLNKTKTTWPGDKMTKVGQDSDQHDIYLWDGGTETGNTMPTGIVFSTGTGSPQTPTEGYFLFANGGYYDASGYLTSVTTGIQKVTAPATTTFGVTYNLNGQRVGDNYRGLIILNGKKVLKK